MTATPQDYAEKFIGEKVVPNETDRPLSVHYSGAWFAYEAGTGWREVKEAAVRAEVTRFLWRVLGEDKLTERLTGDVLACVKAALMVPEHGDGVPEMFLTFREGVMTATPADVLALMEFVNMASKRGGGVPWYYIGVPGGIFERLATPLKVIRVTINGDIIAEAPFNPAITQAGWGKSPLPKTKSVYFSPEETIVEDGYVVGISTLQKVDCMNQKYINFDPAALTTVGPMEKKEP